MLAADNEDVRLAQMVVLGIDGLEAAADRGSDGLGAAAHPGSDGADADRGSDGAAEHPASDGATAGW